MEVAWLITSLNYLFSKLYSTFSTLSKHLAKCKFCALCKTDILYCLKLSLAIRAKAIDSNNYRNALFLKVINMSLKVNSTCLKSLYIFCSKVSLCNTTVVLKCTNSCYENYC